MQSDQYCSLGKLVRMMLPSCFHDDYYNQWVNKCHISIWNTNVAINCHHCKAVKCKNSFKTTMGNRKGLSAGKLRGHWIKICINKKYFRTLLPQCTSLQLLYWESWILVCAIVGLKNAPPPPPPDPRLEILWVSHYYYRNQCLVLSQYHKCNAQEGPH